MVGAIAISLIGIFNIAGSLLSGAFGQRFSKKWGLSGIYAVRAVTLLVFLVAPKSELTIYIFAATMGLLWLSTVPLTAGIIAQVFGIRYMATLYGFVFLGHQIGSFIGVWMGGIVRSHVASGHHIGSWCSVDSPADKRTACPTTAGGINYTALRYCGGWHPLVDKLHPKLWKCHLIEKRHRPSNLQCRQRLPIGYARVLIRPAFWSTLTSVPFWKNDDRFNPACFENRCSRHAN